MKIDLPLAYGEAYHQYGSDAAFLWLLRSMVINQPHYNDKDIAELELRLSAHLDGLMSSIESGWDVCQQGLVLAEAGEVFAAMVFAMRSRDVKKIQCAVEVGLGNPMALKGLVSALGWLPQHVVEPWISRFLNGKDLKHKLLGLAGCSVRRQDPGVILDSIFQRAECLEDEAIYARALRLVGELRRQDCMPYVLIGINSELESVRFWASWSAGLLGDHACLSSLRQFVFNPSPFQEHAINLAFRLLPVDVARQWISQMSKDTHLGRAVIKATGVLGDPHAVNWLIAKMAVPSLAKLAGEAFYNITGLHIVDNNLNAQTPPRSGDIQDMELDEDENLAMPSPHLVATIWRSRGARFIVGRRYFLGELIHAQSLLAYVEQGYQRQRHGAAIELALQENGCALVNTRKCMAVAN